MDEEIKDRLMKFIKKSRYLIESWEYVKRDEYKQIDKIYGSNEREVVDILYNLALDVNIENIWENDSYIFILHYLLLEHEDVDDVTYIKSMYRKMILKIFENDKYKKFRIFNQITDVGFTKNEAEDLYRSHIVAETDPDVIKKYKYEILRYEYDRLYPGIFNYIICILELHTPGERKTEALQFNIDLEVTKHGEKTVYEWSNLFLNNKYASKDAKDILKQVKIGDSVW